MSGDQIALTSIIVIGVFALLFAFVVSQKKPPRKGP